MPNMKISELIINKDVKFQENEKQIIPHFENEKKLLIKLIHMYTQLFKIKTCPLHSRFIVLLLYLNSYFV